MTTYAIMDTETTGLNMTALPVEVACVLTDDSFRVHTDGNHVSSVIVNPFAENSLDRDILERESESLVSSASIHKLSPEMVKKGCSVHSLFQLDDQGNIEAIKIGNIRIGKDVPIVFHNAEYDMKIFYNAASAAGLREQFLEFVKEIEIIDTVEYFRAKRVGKQNSLGAIAKSMQIEHEDIESILKKDGLDCPPERRIRHAALYDCILLCNVLAKDQLQKSLLSSFNLDSYRKSGDTFIKLMDVSTSGERKTESARTKTMVVPPTEEEKQAHLAMMKKIKDIMNQGRKPDDEPLEPIWKI